MASRRWEVRRGGRLVGKVMIVSFELSKRQMKNLQILVGEMSHNIKNQSWHKYSREKSWN